MNAMYLLYRIVIQWQINRDKGIGEVYFWLCSCYYYDRIDCQGLTSKLTINNKHFQCVI